jgi:hypothetical protein
MFYVVSQFGNHYKGNSREAAIAKRDQLIAAGYANAKALQRASNGTFGYYL